MSDFIESSDSIIKKSTSDNEIKNNYCKNEYNLNEDENKVRKYIYLF
jgi:hypothetical protein